MFAFRKCLKIACFHLNDDTAFALFIVIGSNGRTVYQHFDKVGECRVGLEGQIVFAALVPLGISAVNDTRCELVNGNCSLLITADLAFLMLCSGFGDSGFLVDLPLKSVICFVALGLADCAFVPVLTIVVCPFGFPGMSQCLAGLKGFGTLFTAGAGVIVYCLCRAGSS